MAEKKQYVTPEIIVVAPEDKGGSARYRLPYGIAKGMGLNTDGMTPREVWEMLKGKGVNPDNAYEELEKKAKTEIKEEKPVEVDAQKEVHKKTITQSKAFNTLPKTAKEKVEKNLDKLSSDQIGIMAKYADKLYEFTNGSGQYGTGGGYIRYEQNSNGNTLDKELGFDFEATTFYHEYGHFIDNMVAKDKTGIYTKYDSTEVNVNEDALYSFNEIMKLGGLSQPLKDLSRITRDQYQAFYKGIAIATGKDKLMPYKSRVDFGYVREPYKPTYTPEKSRELFGEYGYENSLKLWQEYNKNYEAWQMAEKDGTNAKAIQKQKEYEAKMYEHNKVIDANLRRCSIITDFIGLYTNNKINLYKEGYFAHKGSYNKSHNAQGEALAEYFSLKMTNDTKGIEIMKKYLPKTYDAFEKKYNALMEK